MPIVMVNFKFKIIYKVLANILDQVLPHIISKEQRGFAHGREINNCICLASEAINLIRKKAFGVNFSLNINTSKAFDTLNRGLFHKVINKFSFKSIFCNWFHVILSFSYISIYINGAYQGLFKCGIWMRQGYPLHPLLFCILEDVLSKSIAKLIVDGKLAQIKGVRPFFDPSHCLYVDDVIIYYNEKA